MMPPARDYYEVLGISQDATLEEIKKSYRQLVRKFHPDVHHDKKLAERAFVQINEAYRVLSDPIQRRSYDQDRAARAREAAARARAASSSGSRPGGTRAGQSARASRTSAPGGGGRQGEAGTAAGLTRDAELAFIRGRLLEAESLARRAVQRDRTSARAYIILGDVYNARNIRDKALQYYSYAVQFDPDNRALQAKVERIVGAGAAARMRGAARQGRTHAGASSVLAHLLGWSAFFMLFFVAASAPPVGLSASDPMDLLAVLHHTPVLLSLCADGLLLGLLLRSGNVLGHHEDEMMFQTIGRGAARPAAAPIGLIMVVLAAVLFWAALAAYFVVASVQENMSRSLTRAFTATLFCVLAIAALQLMQGGPAFSVLAVGGNFVFVALLAGWWMVDVWRAAGMRAD